MGGRIRMTTPYIITRAQLQSKMIPGCPAIKYFDHSPYLKNDELVFPEGFSTKEATDIAKRNPTALRLLAKIGLCPMTEAQAKTLIAQVAQDANVPPEVRRAMTFGTRPVRPTPAAPVLERRSSADKRGK
jgi:hypothetical protein